MLNLYMLKPTLELFLECNQSAVLDFVLRILISLLIQDSWLVQDLIGYRQFRFADLHREFSLDTYYFVLKKCMLFTLLKDKYYLVKTVKMFYNIHLIYFIFYRFDYDSKSLTNYAGTLFDNNRVNFQISGFEIVWACNYKSLVFLLALIFCIDTIYTYILISTNCTI